MPRLPPSAGHADGHHCACAERAGRGGARALGPPRGRVSALRAEVGLPRALDLVPPLGKGEWQRPAPSGDHAVGREEGRSHVPLLEATPLASKGTFQLGWEENPPSSKKARSQGCGTGKLYLLHPGKAIRWVPNPWGPRSICQVWNSELPRGAGPGQGAGLPGAPPRVVWGLEGLGWWLEGPRVYQSPF